MKILIFILSSSSFSVVLAKRAVNSVLSLILVYISSFFIFLYNGLSFLAVLFFIVYIGAIAILFLSVVMMLNLRTSLLFSKREKKSYFFFFFFFVISLFFSITNLFFYNTKVFFFVENYQIYINSSLDYYVNLNYLGEVLYNNYIIFVYLAGLLLLLALIGSLLLVKSSVFYKKSAFFFDITKYRGDSLFLKNGGF
jgi:NADH-quinone oxidoreductase subunit J